MAPHPQIPRVKISGKLATDKVPKVLNPIDIGNGRGDQMTGHLRNFLVGLGCFNGGFRWLPDAMVIQG